MKYNKKSKNAVWRHKKRKQQILETSCQNEKQNEKEKDVDNVSPLPEKSYNQDDDTESNTAINQSSKLDDEYNHSSNSDTSDLNETASKTENYSFMNSSKL